MHDRLMLLRAKRWTSSRTGKLKTSNSPQKASWSTVVLIFAARSDRGQCFLFSLPPANSHNLLDVAESKLHSSELEGDSSKAGSFLSAFNRHGKALKSGVFPMGCILVHTSAFKR